MPSIVDRLNINITKRQILKSIEQVKEKERNPDYRNCDRCYVGKLLDIVSKEHPFIVTCTDIKECLNHQYGTNYNTRRIFCISPHRSDNILARLQHRTIHI